MEETIDILLHAFYTCEDKIDIYECFTKNNYRIQKKNGLLNKK
jgi:hypothetical protein